MERNQLRTMFALTLVGLALAAAIGFLGPAEERSDPDATVHVWQVDADTVYRVEIERQDDTVVVAKHEDEWRVETPWQGVGDPDTINDLLAALSEVERGVPIESPGPLGDYGLEPPVARVRISQTDREDVEGTFGDESPVGFRTYALGSERSVVAVGGRPGRSLLANASDFKDRRVFHVDPSEVRRVTIESAQGRLSLSGEKTAWWLDGFTRAEPSRVDDLIMGLLNIRIDEFLDLSDTLSEPAIVVDVEVASGQVSRIKVGDPTPLGVLVEYEGGFGTVFAESLKLLVQGPTDVGDSQAFSIDAESVRAVSVSLGGTEWMALSAGTTWTVDEVETPKAQDIVDALADAVIHYRAEEVPSIGDVWATVRVEAGDATQIVDLGQVAESTFRVAQDRAGGGPYLVPLVDLAVLDQPLP
jgi:hypothetical protein